jgi:hypothetical protein
MECGTPGIGWDLMTKGNKALFLRITRIALILTVTLLWGVNVVMAQQKPQWMPGQMGLNAGVLPSPGFTYANITINYSAGAFNDQNGKAVAVAGNYNVWAVENAFYYVPNTKFLGGNIAFQMVFPTLANGSLVADFTKFPNLGVTGGGEGVGDLWIQPITIGWHLKRADIIVADAFMVPTGRYAPGASDNIGSGYFGNHLQSSATVYVTKNRGTSVNVYTDYEVHGNRQQANNNFTTPGQAFTTEWGVGQILPLKKDFSKLLQLGVIGYDQWQLTSNDGTTGLGLPARLAPLYSVHAAGGQANYILPAKNLALFFKYEHEYASSSHTLGNTIVFGGSWTMKIPKPVPPKS